MDVETRIVALERRVAELEGEARGEQQLSRRLFEYVHEMRADIAILRAHAVTVDQRIGQFEQRLERLEQRIEQIDGRLAALSTEFSAFRRELPGMIAETLRDVLRENRS